MTKLVCMRGFSGGGKSVMARMIADEIGGVVVNRDYFRKMLLGEWYTGHRGGEDRVTVAEESSVKALLQAGVNVVVDATHLNSQYLRKWAKLAGQLSADFEVIDVRTDVEECVRRDRERGLAGERSVGEKVIRDQAKRFPMEKWPVVAGRPPLVVEPVEFDPSLPDCVIFDIDSTLAHRHDHGNGKRSPYDFSRVGEDVPDVQIRWLNNLIWNDRDYPDMRILIVSGRDDTCKEATEKWLTDNSIWFDELHMRDTAGDVDERGNKDADYRSKYRIFNDHIRGRFNVRFVVDDRAQVISMWRSLGLKVLDVAGNQF